MYLECKINKQPTKIKVEDTGELSQSQPTKTKVEDSGELSRSQPTTYNKG